jgi:hypothetical protein
LFTCSGSREGRKKKKIRRRRRRRRREEEGLPGVEGADGLTGGAWCDWRW